MEDEPREPGGWRDWVRAEYEYPDDWDDLPRRQRRRAQRKWRQEDHAQRMAWLRERRQTEPASPAGVLIAVIVLVIVVLGVGGYGSRLLNAGKSEQPSIGLLTPVVPEASVPQVPTVTESGVASQPPSSASSPRSTPTPVPVLTQRPSVADVAAASRIAVTWGRVFYTRQPATETYQQLVSRAGRYTTSAVAASFSAAGDPTYEALKAAHGSSRVLSATSAQPRPGTAPVDTPTRITRLVTIKVQIVGTRPAQLTLPMMLTLVGGGSHWLVSDVNGGAGT